MNPDLRERLIRDVATAIHECTSHPDYPSFDEAPCCGTPQPAMVNPVEFHKDAGHETGRRGVCWWCEPAAATVVDDVLAKLDIRGPA